MTIGERLRKARRKEERTQKWCASLLGVSVSTYKRYENGLSEPTIAQIQQLAKALKTPIEFLVDLDQTGFSYEGYPDKTMSEYEKMNYSDMENTRDIHCLIDNPLYAQEYRVLLARFSSLNGNGRRVALERIEELALIDKYTSTEM